MPIRLSQDEIAEEFGGNPYTASEPEAGWGTRLGASVDRFQAGLLGVGEAFTGSETLGRMRRENLAESEINRARAIRDTGATDNFRDISGLGSLGSFVGGLLVDSAPELALSAATGGAGALAGLGTAGRLGLAAAASSPSALGDILQNQRDEAGHTNLLSAVPLTVPYVAADMLGLDGALASGKMMRTGLQSLDAMQGAKGVASRLGANTGLNFLAEGGGETGQEITNQLGRMSVNPDQTLFNPEANDRYLDSFVGGGLMGGTVSGAMGGWRRSERYQPPRTNLDDPATPSDLLGTGPKLEDTTPGAQGSLFGDLGIDGLMSEIPQDRSPEEVTQAFVQKYQELSGSLRQVESVMADAEAAGDNSRFYALQELRDDLVRQLEPLERRWSAIQAEQSQPGQMGLFGSVEAPQAPALLATQDGQVGTERQFSGQQFNLFDGPTTFGGETAPTVEEAPPLPQRDTQTRDMLVETPTAMVQTMFNPATEPNTYAQSAFALDGKVRGNQPKGGQATAPARGAIYGQLRTQMVQRLGKIGGYGETLVRDMAHAMFTTDDAAGVVRSVTDVVRKAAAEQDAAMQRLDNEVADYIIDPESAEYKKRRKDIEDKQLAVMAAQELVDAQQRAMTNAYATEGAARPQPGQSVGTAPEETGATERAMRDNSMAAAVAEHDANVATYEQSRRQDNAARERRAVLEQVLSSPNPRDWSAAKFSAALKAAGFTDTKATPQEQEEIVARTDRRNDVRAAAKTPPGPAAAQGRLTPRSSLEAEPAAQPAPVTEPARVDIPAETGAVAPQSQPAAKASQAPAKQTQRVQAVSQPAQASPAVGSQPASPAPGVPAAGTAAVEASGLTPAKKAPSKPKRASADAANAPLQDLFDTIDNEKDELVFDGAMDALYRRYNSGTSEDIAAIDAYFEQQEGALDPSWAAAEKRFEETERGVMGKRGFAQKNDAPTPEQIRKNAEADPFRAAGVWSQGTAQSNGGSVTVEHAQQIAKKVLQKLGIAAVVRIEVFRNPAEAGMEAPPGVDPSGVLTVDGRILLFTDNIASELDVFRTVFHELFHLGLSKTVEQNAYVQQMLRFKLDDLVNRYAKRWKQSPDGVDRKGTLPMQNYEALAVEEALADIAEDLGTGALGSKEMKPFVRSVVGKLADLAQFVGLDKAAQALRRMTYSKAEKFVMDTIVGADFRGSTKLSARRYRQATVPTEAELTAAEEAEGVPSRLVESWKTRPFGVVARNAMSGWRGNPGLLGALSLDQLKDRFPEFKNVTATIDKWLSMGNRADQMIRPVADLHKQWASFTRKNKAHGQALNKLFIEATLGGVWVDGAMEPRQDPRNKHLDFTDPQVVKAATTARSLYNSLPEAGQRLYREITADLGRQFEARQRALLKRVVDAYKGDMKGLLTPAQMMEMAEVGAKKRAAMLDSNRAQWGAKDTARVHAFTQALDMAYVSRAEVPGPYFPLTRKGDHVVVFKTDKFKRAEQELKDARQALDDLLAQPIPEDSAQSEALADSIVAARKRVTQAKGALETAKGSDNDYIVEFYEYRVQAQDRAKELGAGAQVKTRQLFMDRTDGIPAGFLNKLDAQVRNELGSQSAKDVADAVRQMVIRSLPERSAFKAEMRRMKVAGANPEHAMWAYLSSSHRNAWTVSRLENITDMTTAMNEARASENQDEVLVANELVRRYSGSLAYNETNALIDTASNLSYLTHLGLSVGYWVQNMVQPWTVSLPVMAGTYGFRASAKALATATGDAVRAVQATIRKNKAGTNWDMPVDLSAFKDHEQVLLNRMLDAGKIDITVRADLTSGESTATNPLGHVVQQAANLSSLPAHVVESVNRVATALAVYRLALEKGHSVEEATAAAEKVVVQTHVDYSVENAPRFMNPNALGGLGRLAFQFRRYQQAMVFLWGKLLVDAVKHGDKDSAKALMYLTGTTFAVAGTSGLPLAAPLGLAANAIVNAFSEDDEDKDRVEQFWAGVQSVVGETRANLLRKGVPAMMGVDVSQRIGMGSILSPVYNMPNAKTGQEWMGAVAATLFGASGGMVAGWADAAYLAQDNPVAAMGKFLPAGGRAFLQAVDRETRGVVDRKGNVLVDEAELGGFDFAVKALNLGEVTDVGNMYSRRAAIKAAESGRTDVRNRLMREYTRARLDGDADAVTDIRAEIDAFNARQPGARIKFSNLQASFKEEQRRRREMQSGVRLTNRNQDIAQDFGVTAE